MLLYTFKKTYKDLYIVNQKMLIKKIRVVLNKWRDMLLPRKGKINIKQILILPNLIYRLNMISINAGQTFVEIDIFL
jgi:ribosomal protein S19